MQNDNSTIFLIDSFAQIFRSYYAVRALSNKKGEPTNAIFAFLRFLLKLESDHPQVRGAFAFDHGRPPHRMALAPDYKANRPPCPEDLKAQIPVIRDLIHAFGWNIVEAENTEADDLIASIALQFTDAPVRIVSADKDLCQVIDDRIEMLVPDQAGKGFAKRGLKEVQEKFGVPATAIVDYLAMIGDTADNIPGVPKVGPKTAAQLLNQFGSIENMIARAGEIARESLREKIDSSHELLRKNVALVKLVTTPPGNVPWDPAILIKKRPDFDAIRAIAEEKELRSLFREIDNLASALTSAPVPVEPPPAKVEEKKPAQMEQMTLF